MSFMGWMVMFRFFLSVKSYITIFFPASMRVLRHMVGLCEQIPFHPSALLHPEDCCSPESMQAHTRGILNRQKSPVVFTGGDGGHQDYQQPLQSSYMWANKRRKRNANQQVVPMARQHFTYSL